MHSEGDGEIVRDGVKDMRESPLGPGVPGREDPFEFLWDETTIIDLDRGPGDALSGDCVCQGRESQLVGEEGIAPFSEQAETFCDTIAVPESEGDRVVPRRMEGFDEVGQRVESGRDSGAGTVSESGLEGKRSIAFSVGDRLGGA